MKKISVIVPVYNVEKYLNKCVDSILTQTYKDLEIFLVDDGSTDNCPAICDTYAKTDKRIKVIHKTNGGLSDARNVAIDVATGKYITFIDSDDYIDNDMIDLLYTSLVNNKCDISTIRYRSFYDDEPQTEEHAPNDEHVLSGEAALENMLYQKNTTNSAWGKLYKTELFTDIRYPFGKICEDLGTTYKLFSHSNKIVLNSSRKYHYLQRMNSIINSNFSPRRMDALDFAKDQLDYVTLNHDQITDAAKNRLFIEAIFIAIEIPRGPQYETERLRCNRTMKALSRDIVRDAKSQNSFRLYAAIAMISANLLINIFKFKKTVRNSKNITRIFIRSNNV